MSTVKALIAEARQLILAGDLEAAEAKKNQASALKALDDLDAPPTVDPSARLPFSTEPEKAPSSAESIAVKSWYHNHFGSSDSDDLNQVMTELYGHDHQRYAWAKSTDFVNYIRTGQFNPKLHRALVYSPSQVKSFLDLGMGIAEMKATQIESQDVLGGYLVPEDFRDRMIIRLQGLTAMRQVSEIMTTTRDRITMPVSTGGDSRYTGAVRVFKVDESPTGTEAATNATFGQVTIPVHTMMGHVAVSKNLLEDSAGALAVLPYLERQFASAFAIFDDQQYLVGNGVGGPQGILQNSTTGGPFPFAYGEIQTVNSGANTALQADAFRNTPYAIDTQYRTAGAKWIMSKGSVRTVKTLKAGDGTYLWSGRSDTPQLQQGQPPQIEGYGILESEVLGSPTTASNTTYTQNTYPILFVTQGSYLIVDRIGMDIMRYDDSVTGKANSIVLVARKRGGGQVIAPWGIAVMKVSA